tara:strand:+ start:42269 stop:43726 length:1458 start_codon:yes stop_codon:yes gene_type:complete
MNKQENLRALFNPKGIAVIGASTHPGKFGFVALHNILSAGFEGNIFATNPKTPEILGIQTLGSVSEIPNGMIDVAMICLGPDQAIDILPELADKGVRSAFLVSGGFRESGEKGMELEQKLVETANTLGIAIAGPNGQGFISTPAKLCSQIVSPYPPNGSISIASQSGNILSAFLNLSRAQNIGVARAISIGNQAQLSIEDYIRYFGDDAETKVVVAYVEGLPNGRKFFEVLKEVTKGKPVVIIRGGYTNDGAKAASSHTGSMASDQKIFETAVSQAGGILAEDPIEAFEFASSFAVTPTPKGRNVIILTTAGGWGVITSDAISDSSLNLLPLPPDLEVSIDEHLPPRWSKSNPIDLAGGETRDTIPSLISLVLAHREVDSMIFLGLGIQGNVARSYLESPIVTDDTKRMANFHIAQEKRYSEAIINASIEFQKPIFVSTEIAIADLNNPGPKSLKDSGALCFNSPLSAVKALDVVTNYSLRDSIS